VPALKAVESLEAVTGTLEFEVVDGGPPPVESPSSLKGDGTFRFIRQKKDLRAPGQRREPPEGTSAFTGSIAAKINSIYTRIFSICPIARHAPRMTLDRAACQYHLKK